MHTRNELADATLDHAVLVGSTLDVLSEAFAEVGLDAEYAGALENDINHLSQLAFPDGSYFELLSTLEPEQESPWWNDHLKRDGGPCAWALESDDIEADTERIRETGIPVDGPTRYGRERPNGTYFDYELTIVGNGGVATKFPFLIQDHTPRSNRVQWPSESVAETALTGVAFVVVGVADLDSSVDEYRALFDLEDPEITDSDALGATLARFPETPIVLAEPSSEASCLATRIDEHGERPAAYLLGTDDFTGSVEQFDLVTGDSVLGYDCGWFEREGFDAINTRLGVLGDA
ncbi:MAG: VOC family protein [Halobacteriota archaeon]